MHEEAQNYEKINAALVYLHFQHTNWLSNRLIDYCVNWLFNNRLHALVDYRLMN